MKSDRLTLNGMEILNKLIDKKLFEPLPEDVTCTDSTMGFLFNAMMGQIELAKFCLKFAKVVTESGSEEMLAQRLEWIKSQHSRLINGNWIYE